MAATSVNVLMENLEQLMNYKIDLISEEKEQIGSLYESLGFLRTSLEDQEEKFYEHEELKDLETRVRDVAYEAENTIDLFTVNSILKRDIAMKKTKTVIGRAEEIESVLDCSLNLDHVRQEIEAIKTKVMEIYDKKIYDLGAIQVGISSKEDSSRSNTPTGEEETTVGFDEEAMIIKEQLTGGPKQLEVISIVGMAGLGKTTLARKVYNDPLIVYHFYIRAWIYVSQEYRKRDLLLRLLSSVSQHTNGIDQMSDEKLAEKLYKRLKGRIYFIVMDDIWDSKAWFDLKNYFPNDNNGSRIIFTSRLADLALHANPRSPPISLRFLTEDESWDLLQQKVFQRGSCPPELMKIGKQIAKNCQGLPLAIVVVAGILANEEKRQDRWKQVRTAINSWMVGDQQQWMKTIALSYNHLPRHLKPCFLYFGAFPEDFEIPAQKLILLWVAEGFIRKTREKSLEDVAEEYLMDLIDRSLVLVLRRRFDGGIKACGIHDLLRDFCLKKAKEESFLQHISDHRHFSSTIFTSKHFSCMRRLCVHPLILQNTSLIPSALNIRSFLCMDRRYGGVPTLEFLDHRYGGVPNLEFLSRCFKLLRVLDISSTGIDRYPCEIGQLILLRYLGLTLHRHSEVPDSISNLWNLETLIIDTWTSVTLPKCIRKMVNLRHLFLSGIATFGWEAPHARYPFSLDNLQTLSWVDPCFCADFLAGTPNLRTLGIQGDLEDGLTLPQLEFLNHLRKLKLCNTGADAHRTMFPNIGRVSENSKILGRIKFPTNLRKLTLKKTYLKWNEMSILSKLLPNLEVLKLKHDACTGQRWETSDGEFPRLKYLKFVDLDIVWWNASSNHFPTLQRLVLIRCSFLQKIPSEIGYVPTLQMIEISECHSSTAYSAMAIKEEQESVGNNWLQTNIASNNVD